MNNSGLFIAFPQGEVEINITKEDWVMNIHNFEQQGKGESNVFDSLAAGRLFTSHKIESGTKAPRIIAIGGGKGGVGKTITSILLGISLAGMQKSTVIVDADFAGANLHGYLNVTDPDMTINYYFARQTRDLNEVAQGTAFPHLKIIPGMPGHLKSIQMKYWEKQKLLRNIRKLNADYVILDLGPGTSFNNIDFFLNADDSVIISTPDPMSIYDAYGYIRAALFRKLVRTFRHWPDFLHNLRDCGDITRGKDVKSIASCLDQQSDIPPSWRALIQNSIRALRPKVLLNMVRENESPHELQAVRLRAKELLDIGVENWGAVRYDPWMRLAVKSRRIELLLDKGSVSLDDVNEVVKNQIIRHEEQIHRTPDGWVDEVAIQPTQSAEMHFRICNYRCIAWDTCDERDGGMPCRKLEPAPVTMSLAS